MGIVGGFVKAVVGPEVKAAMTAVATAAAAKALHDGAAWVGKTQGENSAFAKGARGLAKAGDAINVQMHDRALFEAEQAKKAGSLGYIRATVIGHVLPAVGSKGKAQLGQQTPEELYRQGQEAEQNGDFPLAFQFYYAAAAAGYLPAMNDLAYCYDVGQGTPQDKSEALHVYRKAADKGHANARYNLGYMLHHGEGTPVNRVEAAVWFRLAAGQGHAEAQCSIGDYCRYGLGGVPPNSIEARHWFQLAAGQGSAEAVNALAALDAVEREQQAKRRSRGRRINPHPENSKPWARFELTVTENATKAEIEAAYRSWIMVGHPDHGGDAGWKIDLDNARKMLLAAL